jgi:hypothetical protein
MELENNYYHYCLLGDYWHKVNDAFNQQELPTKTLEAKAQTEPAGQSTDAQPTQWMIVEVHTGAKLSAEILNIEMRKNIENGACKIVEHSQPAS